MSYPIKEIGCSIPNEKANTNNEVDILEHIRVMKERSKCNHDCCKDDFVDDLQYFHRGRFLATEQFFPKLFHPENCKIHIWNFIKLPY